MARSTQSSPSPQHARRTGSQKRPAFVHISEDDDSDASVITHADVDGHDTSDTSHHSMMEVDDKLSDLAQDDDKYLTSIATAAVAASQSAADEEPRGRHKPPSLKNILSKGRRRDLFDIILNNIWRADLRHKIFDDFVPYEARNSLAVPKKASKEFLKARADKFISLFNIYKKAAKTGEANSLLLRGFELLLTELMDCLDHPKEVALFNPFCAFADFVEAGAVVRCPRDLQACSRLTLGADWGLLTTQDEKRIGPKLMLRLERLRAWRVAEVDEILFRWSDKFPKQSTCTVCNTDPWELFLLTVLVGLKKEGTRYIDVETASDTSSESGEEGSDDSDDITDNDASHDKADVDEEDNDGGVDSDSGESVMLDDDDNIDPRLTATLPPIDTDEPPRPSTAGLAPRQSFLRNYGPNAYILRIVSMESFGSPAWKRRHVDSCFSCGYRFDGKQPSRSKRYAQLIERAVAKAREQIADLQEFIDLKQV